MQARNLKKNRPRDRDQKVPEGRNLKADDTYVETHVKVIVLCGTCDVPAKAALMNMKGHSGYYSCPKCFIIGEKSERTENRNLTFKMRKIKKECVQRSIVNKAEYKGVFGPTLLSFMVHSSFISSVSIDSMHCLYIGFTKQLLNLLFNTKYFSSKFSLCSKTVEVNARLKQLQLPHFVERLPEDVTKLSFWKASLCRNFILYIINPTALSVLNSSSISLSDLETADIDLCKFCADFENLYSVRHMSSNLHLLRHLASSVHDTGNLFISSCFRFEDLNGKLADLAHGTRHATMQIASNFNVMSKLPILISNVSSDSAKLFCRKVLALRSTSEDHLSNDSRMFDVEDLLSTYAPAEHYRAPPRGPLPSPTTALMPRSPKPKSSPGPKPCLGAQP
ncbi:Protein PopC [Frankliniella fusca]|uniref:Protein PopC n=1 Tax=Frankliniella fusca TaxID=407009 RepID=A0AAE1GYM1_9NEOP|nr:Protein PopC [Frankliniella fusca]KAK3911499.1 Protein PopC [Frankliniella fusca]